MDDDIAVRRAECYCRCYQALLEIPEQSRDALLIVALRLQWRYRWLAVRVWREIERDRVRVVGG